MTVFIGYLKESTQKSRPIELVNLARLQDTWSYKNELYFYMLVITN